MDIAVIGITPVGCTIACLLADAGNDVTIVGPPEKVARIAESGITVRQVWDGKTVTALVRAASELGHTPELVVFASRMQEVRGDAEMAASHVNGAPVATVQYGTKPEQQVSKFIPRDNIVTCVLTLGATCYSPGDVTLNFKGHMVVGRAYEAADDTVSFVERVMSGVFNVHRGQKIAHFNCTRLLLNLPYCIPAILGQKIQKAFMDPDIAEVAVLLLKEGIKVIEEAEVHIEPLPDFNESSLKALLATPLREAAVRFGNITMNMSKIPCQGPLLGSIEQGELTEVDYINGEVARIAEILGYPTPLNTLMVEMVHEVERTREFFPKDAFLERVRELI